MPKFPVAYVDLRVFAHATEDQDKVMAAVQSVISQEHREISQWKKTSMTGHHGNPIVLLEARIEDEHAIEGILGNLAQGLTAIDKERLSNEFEQFFERGNLYLRLNKQSAYRTRPKLESADPIHLKLHFKRPQIEEVKNVCAGYGLIE